MRTVKRTLSLSACHRKGDKGAVGWMKVSKKHKRWIDGEKAGVTTEGAMGGKSHTIKKNGEKNGSIVMEKEWEHIKNLNFKSHLENNIRLYELNMRTPSFPPGESSWQWLTRGLFCFLGRSWIVMLIFCRPSAQCWVWMERVYRREKPQVCSWTSELFSV